MKAVILIHCPDTYGIVHGVTGFVHSHGGNIVYLDQHVDAASKVFFMRLESDFDALAISLELFKIEFEKEIGLPYHMEWSIHEKK